MAETTYVAINTGKSRLIQLSAIILIVGGVALLYLFRDVTGGSMASLLAVFPALGLLRLSRNFMDQVEYHPPRSEAERRHVRNYGIMKHVFGLLLCASLVALEYSAVLRWGGSIAIIIVGTTAVLCFGMVAFSVAQIERFQRRSL
jgi:hypothetical protein